MRSVFWLVSAAALVCLGNVAIARQAPAAPTPPTHRPPSPARARRVAAAAPGFAVVGTIKELMQNIVDPSADVLFDSVSYNITAAGIEEKQPKTTEDWMDVRRNALLLAEATNLLKIPGRHVAPATPIPGLENEPPGPEDLTPPEIQRLIDADRASFNRLAQGLADAAQVALKAADARSVDRLFESGDAIDQACENCHLKYWYPKGKKLAPDDLSRRKR